MSTASIRKTIECEVTGSCTLWFGFPLQFDVHRLDSLFIEVLAGYRTRNLRNLSVPLTQYIRKGCKDYLKREESAIEPFTRYCVRTDR